MDNKPITPEEMKAYVDATWEKCQAEAWQEPVAWMFVNTDGECEEIEYIKDEPMPDDPSVTPLYAAPRQWQGLTDEEIKEIIGPWGETPIKGYTRKLFDQIEAKLKEKNG
jgi:hypothetical protein